MSIMGELESALNLYDRFKNGTQKTHVDLKSKAYEYVCLNWGASSSDISNYFDVSMEDAIHTMQILSKVDRKVKCIDLEQDPSSPNCRWERG